MSADTDRQAEALERGIIEKLDGTRYVGELQDGEPNGQGVMTDAIGVRHEGSFRDGKLHGQGVKTVPEELLSDDCPMWGRFEGEFRNGEPHGQCTVDITSADGMRIEGKVRVMEDGETQGKCVITIPEGADEMPFWGRIEGECCDWEPLGLCTVNITFPDGKRYEGKWNFVGMDDGEPCGQGVKTMPDGTRYEGEWDGDDLVRGIRTDPDGQRYEGELSGGTFKGILVEDAS